MNRRDLLATLGATGAALAALDPARLWAATTAHSPDSVRSPFDNHQSATIARVADLIIPPTDTPGAVDAGVPAFIAVIVGEWFREDERTTFMAGLEELDQRSRSRAGAAFVALKETDQVAVLTALDEEVQAMRTRDEPVGDTFWQRIKGLTLYGYYTSEAGMKEELRYPVIPGRYEGCMPLAAR